MGKKRQSSTATLDDSVIPFTPNLSENMKMVENLKMAVVVENEDIIELDRAESILSSSNIPVKIKAVEEDSELWELFDDMRRWTEGESFNDRLVWLECFRLHPKGWSIENVKKIGERWGPVIRVDCPKEPITSLTHARFLQFQSRSVNENELDSSNIQYVSESKGEGAVKVVETQENNSNPENQQVNTIHRGNGSNEDYVDMVGSSTLGSLNSKNLFDREGPVFEHDTNERRVGSHSESSIGYAHDYNVDHHIPLLVERPSGLSLDDWLDPICVEDLYSPMVVLPKVTQPVA
ncbi:unnamed protein product [Amaranthus hypochondriacus]